MNLSALNYMDYHKGTSGSYQAWTDAMGDQGYTVENILPWFRQLHHQIIRIPLDLRTCRRTYDNALGSPLKVPYSNYAQLLQINFRTAWLAAIRISVDSSMSFRGLFRSNLVQNIINPKNEHRSSSQTLYLSTAIRHITLKIYT